MSAYTRLLFCTVCIVLLILACMTAGCSSGQTPAATAAPAASTPRGTTIAIKNFAFDPATLTVKSGTTVSWVNQDGTSHTIVSDPVSPVSFSSDTLQTGASYTFSFTQPGTYTYHCSIHHSMKGTIIVQS
jgi:plastocyanin